MPRPPISTLRSFAAEQALRLGLGIPTEGGWVIELHWATEAAILDGVIGRDEAGATDWAPEHRKAIIYISRQHNPTLQDLQETIIHELLHIRLEGHLSRAKRYDPNYEHAINFLSRLLRGAV